MQTFSSWWSFNRVHYENKPLSAEMAAELFEAGAEIRKNEVRDKMENLREGLQDAISDFLMRVDDD